MATIVNNPPTQTSDNGMGFFLGILLIIVLAIVLFVFALPYLRGGFQAPQVNVPSNINVDINKK